MRVALNTVAALLCACTSLSVSATTTTDPHASTNVSDVLASLRHVTNLLEEPCGDYVPYTARCFTFTVTQPVNHFRHRRWSTATFEQKVRIIHRSWDAPVALRTRGYELYADSTPYRYYPIEPTRMLEGNLIDVEHRYYGDSIPGAAAGRPYDYSGLTVLQSAIDLLKVVRTLRGRGRYTGRWVSFGYSKGGMTATFFRRYFPRAVDATVAYVAPLNTDLPDTRGLDYYAGLGSEECRATLLAFQRGVLQRRDEAAGYLAELVASTNDSAAHYKRGGVSEALEYMVSEYDFFFWQYGGEAYCGGVPDAANTSTPIATVMEHLDLHVGLTTYFARSLAQGTDTYYQQVLSELGNSAALLEPLEDLLQYNPNDVSVYGPHDTETPCYSSRTMRGVEHWAKYRATKVMYVYGGGDPWSAVMYPLPYNAVRNDVHRFVAADSNHGADISELADSEGRQEATNTVRRWAGLPELSEDEEAERTADVQVNGLALPRVPAEGRRR